MIARVLGLVVAGGAFVLLAVSAWPQLFGLQRTLPIAQIAAMRGLAALAIVVLLVVVMLIAATSRRLRGLAGLLAVGLIGVGVVDLAVLATRGADASVEPTADDLTVLAWNTLGDAPGATRIADLALEEEADVVALVETSGTTARRVARKMGRAGHPMQVIVLAYDNIAKARSTALLVSDELGEYALAERGETTPYLPSVVAEPVDGSGPRLIAAHPVAPIPGYIEDWRPGLDWIAERCTGNTIVAGDFNATLDHFEGLGDGEGGVLGSCHDAAQEAGGAALGTWPTMLPELLGAPIDHVVATERWEVTGFDVIGSVDDAGSDHRPVVATLRSAD